MNIDQMDPRGYLRTLISLSSKDDPNALLSIAKTLESMPGYKGVFSAADIKEEWNKQYNATQWKKDQIASNFDVELKQIKNTKIRSMVESFLLNNVNSNFFTDFSAFNSTHHPSDESEYKGLILHTKRVAERAMALIEEENKNNKKNTISSDERDYIIASTLLHDTFKNGTGLGPTEWGSYRFDHSELAAKALKKAFPKKQEAAVIADLISTHMGEAGQQAAKKKGYNLPLPMDRLAKIVSKADGLAAAGGYIDTMGHTVPLPSVKGKQRLTVATSSTHKPVNTSTKAAYAAAKKDIDNLFKAIYKDKKNQGTNRLNGSELKTRVGRMFNGADSNTRTLAQKMANGGATGEFSTKSLLTDVSKMLTAMGASASWKYDNKTGNIRLNMKSNNSNVGTSMNIPLGFRGGSEAIKHKMVQEQMLSLRRTSDGQTVFLTPAQELLFNLREQLQATSDKIVPYHSGNGQDYLFVTQGALGEAARRAKETFKTLTSLESHAIVDDDFAKHTANSPGRAASIESMIREDQFINQMIYETGAIESFRDYRVHNKDVGSKALDESDAVVGDKIRSLAKEYINTKQAFKGDVADSLVRKKGASDELINQFHEWFDDYAELKNTLGYGSELSMSKMLTSMRGGRYSWFETFGDPSRKGQQVENSLKRSRYMSDEAKKRIQNRQTNNLFTQSGIDDGFFNIGKQDIKTPENAMYKVLYTTPERVADAWTKTLEDLKAPGGYYDMQVGEQSKKLFGQWKKNGSFSKKNDYELKQLAEKQAKEKIDAEFESLRQMAPSLYDDMTITSASVAEELTSERERSFAYLTPEQYNVLSSDANKAFEKALSSEQSKARLTKRLTETQKERFEIIKQQIEEGSKQAGKEMTDQDLTDATMRHMFTSDYIGKRVAGRSIEDYRDLSIQAKFEDINGEIDSTGQPLYYDLLGVENIKFGTARKLLGGITEDRDTGAVYSDIIYNTLLQNLGLKSGDVDQIRLAKEFKGEAIPGIVRGLISRIIQTQGHTKAHDLLKNGKNSPFIDFLHLSNRTGLIDEKSGRQKQALVFDNAAFNELINSGKASNLLPDIMQYLYGIQKGNKIDLGLDRFIDHSKTGASKYIYGFTKDPSRHFIINDLLNQADVYDWTKNVKISRREQDAMKRSVGLLRSQNGKEYTELNELFFGANGIYSFDTEDNKYNQAIVKDIDDVLRQSALYGKEGNVVDALTYRNANQKNPYIVIGYGDQYANSDNAIDVRELFSGDTALGDKKYIGGHLSEAAQLETVLAKIDEKRKALIAKGGVSEDEIRALVHIPTKYGIGVFGADHPEMAKGFESSAVFLPTLYNNKIKEQFTGNTLYDENPLDKPIERLLHVLYNNGQGYATDSDLSEAAIAATMAMYEAGFTKKGAFEQGAYTKRISGSFSPHAAGISPTEIARLDKQLGATTNETEIKALAKTRNNLVSGVATSEATFKRALNDLKGRYETKGTDGNRRLDQAAYLEGLKNIYKQQNGVEFNYTKQGLDKTKSKIQTQIQHVQNAIIESAKKGNGIAADILRYPSINSRDKKTTSLYINPLLSGMGDIRAGVGIMKLLNGDYDGDTINISLLNPNTDEQIEQLNDLLNMDAQEASDIYDMYNQRGDFKLTEDKNTELFGNEKMKKASNARRNAVIALASKINKGYTGLFSNMSTNVRNALKDLGVDEMELTKDTALSDKQAIGRGMIGKAFFQALEQDAISSKKVEARLDAIGSSRNITDDDIVSILSQYYDLSQKLQGNKGEYKVAELIKDAKDIGLLTPNKAGSGYALESQASAVLFTALKNNFSEKQLAEWYNITQEDIKRGSLSEATLTKILPELSNVFSTSKAKGGALLPTNTGVGVINSRAYNQYGKDDTYGMILQIQNGQRIERDKQERLDAAWNLNLKNATHLYDSKGSFTGVNSELSKNTELWKEKADVLNRVLEIGLKELEMEKEKTSVAEQEAASVESGNKAFKTRAKTNKEVADSYDNVGKALNKINAANSNSPLPESSADEKGALGAATANTKSVGVTSVLNEILPAFPHQGEGAKLITRLKDLDELGRRGEFDTLTSDKDKASMLGLTEDNFIKYRQSYTSTAMGTLVHALIRAQNLRDKAGSNADITQKANNIEAQAYDVFNKELAKYGHNKDTIQEKDTQARAIAMNTIDNLKKYGFGIRNEKGEIVSASSVDELRIVPGIGGIFDGRNVHGGIDSITEKQYIGDTDEVYTGTGKEAGTTRYHFVDHKTSAVGTKLQAEHVLQQIAYQKGYLATAAKVAQKYDELSKTGLTGQELAEKTFTELGMSSYVDESGEIVDLTSQEMANSLSRMLQVNENNRLLDDSIVDVTNTNTGAYQVYKVKSYARYKEEMDQNAILQKFWRGEQLTKEEADDIVNRYGTAELGTSKDHLGISGVVGAFQDENGRADKLREFLSLLREEKELYKEIAKYKKVGADTEFQESELAKKEARIKELQQEIEGEDQKKLDSLSEHDKKLYFSERSEAGYLTNLQEYGDIQKASQAQKLYERAQHEQLASEMKIADVQRKMNLTTSPVELNSLKQIVYYEQQRLAALQAQTKERGVQLQNAEEVTHTHFKEQSDAQYALDYNARLAAVNGKDRGATNIWDKLGQGIKWQITRFFDFNLVTRSISMLTREMRQVIETAKQLNSVATDIRIVTGEDKIQVDNLMVSYTKLAKTLGTSTSAVAQSANTWLRQGYGLSEVTDLIEASTYLSKLGMLDMNTSTKVLTSTLKGFKMEASEAITIVDKLTELDKNYAASAGEIGEALSRVASVAQGVNLDLDKTSAMIAVIMDVTQQEAGAVGTSLRSVLSRYSNVKSGKFTALSEGDEEDADSLNDVESVLKAIGITVRSSTLEMRNFDDVLDDLADKWVTLSTVEKNAVSTAMAGTRQRNAFQALMDNYDKYEDAVETSQNSTGTALTKWEAQVESVEYALQQLKTAWEELAQKIVNSEAIKTLYKIGEWAVEHLPYLLTTATSFIGVFSSYKLPGLIKQIPQRFSLLKSSMYQRTVNGVDENGNPMYGPVSRTSGNFVGGGLTPTQKILSSINANVATITGAVTATSGANSAGSNADLSKYTTGRFGRLRIHGKDSDKSINAAIRSLTPQGMTTKQYLKDLHAISKYDATAAKLENGQLTLNDKGKIKGFHPFANYWYFGKNNDGKTNFGQLIERMNSWGSNTDVGKLITEKSEIEARIANGTSTDADTARLAEIEAKMDTDDFKTAAVKESEQRLQNAKETQMLVNARQAQRQQSLYMGLGAGVSAGLTGALTSNTNKWAGFAGMMDSKNSFAQINEIQSDATDMAVNGVANGVATGFLTAIPGIGPFLGPVLGPIIGDGIGGLFKWLRHKDEIDRKERVDEAKAELEALNKYSTNISNLMGLVTTNANDLDSDDWKVLSDAKDAIIGLMSESDDDQAVGAKYTNNFVEALKEMGVAAGNTTTALETLASAGTNYTKVIAAAKAAEVWTNAQSSYAAAEEEIDNIKEKISEQNDIINNSSSTALAKQEAEAAKSRYQAQLDAKNDILTTGAREWAYYLTAGTMTSQDIATSSLDTVVYSVLRQMAEKDSSVFYKNGVATTDAYNEVVSLLRENEQFSDLLGGSSNRSIRTIKTNRQSVLDRLAGNSLYNTKTMSDLQSIVNNKDQTGIFKLAQALGIIDDTLKVSDENFTKFNNQLTYTSNLINNNTDTSLQHMASSLGITSEQLENTYSYLDWMTEADIANGVEGLKETFEGWNSIIEDLTDNLSLTQTTLDTISSKYSYLLYDSNGNISTDNITQNLVNLLAGKDQSALTGYAMLRAEELKKDQTAWENFTNSADFISIFTDEALRAQLKGQTNFTNAYTYLATHTDKNGEALSNTYGDKFISSFGALVGELAGTIEEIDIIRDKIIEYRSHLYDLEIDNLQTIKEALSESNEERENEISLIKAREKLENAQNEKQRVYRAGVGWTYESNQEAINEAQKELEELETQKQEEDLQYQIDLLEQQKSMLNNISENENWEAVGKIYDELVSGNEDVLSQIHNIFGSDSMKELITNTAAQQIYNVKDVYTETEGKNVAVAIAKLSQMNTGEDDLEEALKSGTMNDVIDAMQQLDDYKKQYASALSSISSLDETTLTNLMAEMGYDTDDISTIKKDRSSENINKLNTSKTTVKGSDGTEYTQESFKNIIGYSTSNGEFQNKNNTVNWWKDIDENTNRFKHNSGSTYPNFGLYKDRTVFSVSSFNDIEGDGIENSANGLYKFNSDGTVVKNTSASYIWPTDSTYTKDNGYFVWFNNCGYALVNKGWDMYQHFDDYDDNGNKRNSDSEQGVKDLAKYLSGNSTRYSDLYKGAKISEYASGSLNTSLGAALINELGTEGIITPNGTLTALPAHSGIVPADLTKNLYELGEIAPTMIKRWAFVNNTEPKNSSSNTDNSMNVQNLYATFETDDGFDFEKLLVQARQYVATTRHNKG